MIDADCDFSLRLHPLLDKYLAGDGRSGSMTFQIEVPGPQSGTKYEAPTFTQYAVICGKPKALRVLLDKTQSGTLIPLDAVFFPRSSNTPFDLLSLAILEGHSEILDLLLSHLAHLTQSRVITDPIPFLMTENLQHSTPLLRAVKLKDWASVKKLVQAGADSLQPPKVGHSAFIWVLYNSPDHFAQFLSAAVLQSGKSRVKSAIVRKKWKQENGTIALGSQGGRLVNVLTQFRVGTEAAQMAHEALLEHCPGYERVTVEDVSRHVAAASLCEADGCSATGNQVCPRCRCVYCDAHVLVNDHDCA